MKISPISMILLAIMYSCTLISSEKHFAIIILTYNNHILCIHNLRSALEQNYTNYRIIIIDDASTDGTATLLKKLILEHPKGSRVSIVRNVVRKKSMINHMLALSLCNENEIAVHLDGDDFLAHTNVLKRLNKEYQNSDTWMTWGSYINLSNKERGFSQPLPSHIIENNAIRKYRWSTSHLRTFYVWLYRKIDQIDFYAHKKPLECAVDLALMFPLIELAGQHAHYIHDVLYYYNDLHEKNVHKTTPELQKITSTSLRRKNPYLPLKHKNAKPLRMSVNNNV